MGSDLLGTETKADVNNGSLENSEKAVSVSCSAETLRHCDTQIGRGFNGKVDAHEIVARAEKKTRLISTLTHLLVFVPPFLFKLFNGSLSSLFMRQHAGLFRLGCCPVVFLFSILPGYSSPGTISSLEFWTDQVFSVPDILFRYFCPQSLAIEGMFMPFAEIISVLEHEPSSLC